MKKLRFYVVDDDPVSVNLMRRLLANAGHDVESSNSSLQALDDILQQKPDCVIMDIMMPELDGLELCKRLRREPSLDRTKIVVVSGKPYEFDQNRALAFGADAYFIKPVDPKTIVDQILLIIQDMVQLRYWGVRGTLPVPGEATVRYGGNTSCISLEFPKGELFIFDAGTGIKAFSDHLMTQKSNDITAKIFISHPHWDHINALQFFAPLYIQGNEFEICGPSHGDLTMRELISAQMEGVYFPIKIKQFAARVYFRDLKEQEFEVSDIKIRTMLLNHPGYCLGYRITYKDRSICYITDNELYPENHQFYNKTYFEKLVEFIKGTDILITDCTYTDEEYKKKISFGHSAPTQVTELADLAGIKSLHLYHHDPNQTDADIDRKLEQTQSVLQARNSQIACIAPREKETFRV